MSLLLDTNIVIDLLRGKDAGLHLLEPEREPLMIAAVTVHEVHSGMRVGEEARAEEMLSSFTTLSFGIAEARLSGAWWRRYREQGVTLDLRDLAIAAAAVVRDVPLATGNVKDFPMPELRLEPWPPPPA